MFANFFPGWRTAGHSAATAPCDGSAPVFSFNVINNENGRRPSIIGTDDRSMLYVIIAPADEKGSPDAPSVPYSTADNAWGAYCGKASQRPVLPGNSPGEIISACVVHADSIKGTQIAALESLPHGERGPMAVADPASLDFIAKAYAFVTDGKKRTAGTGAGFPEEPQPELGL